MDNAGVWHDVLERLDITQILLFVIPSLCGAWVLWYRKHFPVWKKFWRDVFEGLRGIPALQAEVKGIRYYVSPNGGGSMMDSITHTEKVMAALVEQIDLVVQTMRAEIQQVLTPEQREQAQTLMREQHTKMQKKHAKELARKLDLSDEQKSALLKGVKEQKDNYQWPLDQAQREAARQQFEQLVQGVLSAEQQEKWTAMKEKQMRKWHHPDEDGLDGHHGHRKDKDCDQ